MDLGILIGRIGKVTEHPGTNNTPFLRIRLAVNIVKRNGAQDTQWHTIFTYNTGLFDYLKEGRLILCAGRYAIDSGIVENMQKLLREGKLTAEQIYAEGMMTAFHIELLPESDITFRQQIAEMVGFTGDDIKAATTEEILKALAEDLSKAYGRNVEIPKPQARTASRQTERSQKREEERQQRRAATSGNGAGNGGGEQPPEREPAATGATTRRTRSTAAAEPAGNGRRRTAGAKPQGGDEPPRGATGGGAAGGGHDDDDVPF